MRREALIIGWAMLLGGCGTELPAPVVLSVDPSSFEEGQAPILRVAFDAVRPQWVDFGEESAGMDTGIEVRIGDRPFFSAEALDENQATSRAPFGLTTGQWDVSVRLADGRQGTLAGGLTVKAGSFPAAYDIESVGDQVLGEPFNLTIHAEGGNAATFGGVVRLRVNKGKISPEVTGPFSEGSRIERVSLNAVDTDLVITVEDSAGNRGSSNPFQVTP